MLLKRQTGHCRDQRGIKEKCLETKENKNATKSTGHNKSSFKREVYSNMILPQETRKISKKQPKLIAKGIRGKKRKIKE